MNQNLSIYYLIFVLFIFASCDSPETNNNDIINLQTRVQKLENQFANLQSEEYRKILIENLNIRKKPSSRSEIVAEAAKNSYLRVLDTKDGWLLVEFYIDNFPFIGYISGNEKYSQKELLPINSEREINKRGLIRIFWEEEIKRELQFNACNLLGVYIKAPNQTMVSQIRNHLVNYLREFDIYLKPVNSFNENNIAQICTNESICSVISIKVNGNNNSSNFQIQLFGSNGIIYYSTSLPLDGKIFD